MKSLAAALLAAATLTSVTSHAADRIDTEGFSLAWGDLREPWMSMTLLSNEDGLIRIAMENLIVNNAATADHYSVGNRDAGFIGSIADGYRVTSLTLRGTWNGAIEVSTTAGWENWPFDARPEPGYAYTSSSISMSVLHAGGSTELPVQRLQSLNGSQAFAMRYGSNLEGEFGFGVSSSAFVQAKGEEIWLDAPDGGHSIWKGDALASIRGDDVVLLVQIAAVPEPATYGMLIAGLGILGCIVRRRDGR